MVIHFSVFNIVSMPLELRIDDIVFNLWLAMVFAVRGTFRSQEPSLDFVSLLDYRGRIWRRLRCALASGSSLCSDVVEPTVPVVDMLIRRSLVAVSQSETMSTASTVLPYMHIHTSLVT